jgi:hypothetical protein
MWNKIKTAAPLLINNPNCGVNFVAVLFQEFDKPLGCRQFCSHRIVLNH